MLGASSKILLPGREGIYRLRLIISVISLFIISLFVLFYFEVSGQLRFEAFYDLRNSIDSYGNSTNQELASFSRSLDGLEPDYFDFSGDREVVETIAGTVIPQDSRTQLYFPDFVIGLFQLDDQTGLTTPLLPSSRMSRRQLLDSGVSSLTVSKRLSSQKAIKKILQNNNLIKPDVTEAFALLTGKSAPKPVTKEEYDTTLAEEFSKKAPRRKTPRLKKSKSVSDYETTVFMTPLAKNAEQFQVSVLDTNHLIFYRSAWLRNSRRFQAVLVDRNAFLNNYFLAGFKALQYYKNLRLTIRDADRLIAEDFGPAYKPKKGGETLISQISLVAPFDKWNMTFLVSQLERRSSQSFLDLLTLAGALVLLGGVWFVYFTVKKRLLLVGQQQNFISAVSHELKTPLTSIRMYSEMLKEGWTTEEKKKEYYNFIYDESERLSRLIQNVLQLSRLNAGRTEEAGIALQRHTVQEVLELVLPPIRASVEKTNFEFHNTSEGSLMKAIDVDVDTLIQILLNLTDNGLKFARDAEPQRIDFSTEVTNNSVVFAVRDYGPGITSDKVTKVFDMFYRGETELTRKTKGTGIGLNLVKQLTEKMSGRVSVLSEPGKTEFFVEFPLV